MAVFSRFGGKRINRIEWISENLALIIRRLRRRKRIRILRDANHFEKRRRPKKTPWFDAKKQPEMMVVPIPIFLIIASFGRRTVRFLQRYRGPFEFKEITKDEYAANLMSFSHNNYSLPAPRLHFNIIVTINFYLDV